MGLGALGAIKAETHNSAKLCDVLAETGTSIAGKEAALLVIDGRPDQTFKDLRNIPLVMWGGAIFRNELPNMAASVLTLTGVTLADGTFAQVC